MTQDWTTFLATQGLAADGAHFGQPAEELLTARDGAVVSPLVDQGVIRATGEDAATFLHNLVSNDIKGITDDVARFAGLCTPKGRLLALFLVWREGQDFLLMLPRDILPGILKRLSMYVLRSKVKLTDVTAERVLLGLSLPLGASPSALPLPFPLLSSATPDQPRFGVVPSDGGQLIRLDPTRWLLVATPEIARERWPMLIDQARLVGLAAWQWLEIAAGQPRVVAATQEAFVPQMLNMELPAVAGVSFTKGCYPGQEIVARTQYLGKIKRRSFRARFAATTATAAIALPGSHVFAPETGDQHCGVLVSVAASPAGGYETLVCVQSAAVEAGEVRLGAPNGEALEFLSLPYELG